MEYHPNQYRVNARHATPRAAHTSMPMPDFTQAAKASAAMVDHADQLQNTLIEEIEYSSSLAEEQRIFDLTNNTLAEYQRRDNLPDGHPESWYDKDGVFQQNVFDAWESEKLYQLTTTPTAGFIRPETKRKVTENALSIRNNLHKQLTKQQADSIPKHARRRLATSYENHIDMGQYANAIKVVSDAPAWVMNDEDKMALIHSANQGYIISEATLAASSGDPAAFLNTYTKHLPNADRNTLIKLRDLARRVTSAAPNASVSRNSNGSVSYKEEYPNLPMGVPDYVYDFYTKNGGQPAFKADTNLRMQALSQLQRFAAESIRSNDPIAIEKVKQVATLMGLDDTAASSVITPVVNRYTKANEYNPAKTSQKLVSWRSYASNAQNAVIAIKDKNVAHIAGQLALLPETATKEQRANLEKQLRDANADLANFAANIKEREEEAETLALAAYDNWRASNPNATQAECITQYYDYLDDYAPGVNAASMQQKELDLAATSAQEFENAYSVQLDAESYDKNVQSTDFKRQFELKQEAAQTYTLECSSAMSGTLENTNNEAIIYLPADSTETRKSIPVSVGKTSIPAKVVKTDKVATAMLSNMLQLQLGVLGSPGYNTILFAKGKANLTHTPQADTFSEGIIALEARRDKDGNLVDYSLSKADGGGTNEIAGINNKYHPEKYAELKALLDAGKHQEAEQKAKDYIIHYTQPAGDYLVTQGVNSPAAEYMLRDIYFNMGAGGMKNVLRRAFGNKPIAEFLRTHNEQDMLQQIYQARADYYAAIIRSKPQKAQFRKGWLNRNNKVFNTALELVK